MYDSICTCLVYERLEMNLDTYYKEKQEDINLNTILSVFSQLLQALCKLKVKFFL